MAKLPLGVDEIKLDLWGTHLQRWGEAEIPEDFKGDNWRRRGVLGRCCFLYALRLQGTSRLALL